MELTNNKGDKRLERHELDRDEGIIVQENRNKGNTDGGYKKKNKGYKRFLMLKALNLFTTCNN